MVLCVLAYQASVNHTTRIEFETAAKSKVITETSRKINPIAESVLLLVTVAIVQHPVVTISGIFSADRPTYATEAAEIKETDV